MIDDEFVLLVSCVGAGVALLVAVELATARLAAGRAVHAVDRLRASVGALWAVVAFASGASSSLDLVQWPGPPVLAGLALAPSILWIAAGTQKRGQAESSPTANRGARLVAAPWVAGESRVALFVYALALSVWFAFVVGRALTHPPSEVFACDDITQLALLLAELTVLVLVPRLALAPWRGHRGFRAAYLTTVLVGWPVVGWIAIRSDRSELSVLVRVFEYVKPDGGISSQAHVAVALVAALSLTTLLLHVPEMLRGVRELRPPRAPASDPSVPSSDETRHVHP